MNGKDLAIAELMGNKPRHWHEIDEEWYDWMLNCLPPIGFDGIDFLNSEPYTHTQSNEGVYCSCIRRNGKFFTRYTTVKEFKECRNQESLPPIKVW